ncbi:MAG TPA: hypothetical protein VFP22_05870 [Candidatus Limnocylindrales bacterium]|nr:hypothetical protein [Candidatus Limnocylindrales bacterium]
MCYARIERRHEIVSNGHACLVLPSDVRWLQDGEPARRGGLMTMALREAVDGWRISVPAWTWD